MHEQAWTDWLTSPETQALLNYVRRRKIRTVEAFLSGLEIIPVMQGRAAALHELEMLLTKPADEVSKILWGEKN